MDKIEVTRYAYILSDAERKKLVHCLDYCYHRLTEHKHDGLTNVGVDTPFVNYMRNAFKEQTDRI